MEYNFVKEESMENITPEQARSVLLEYLYKKFEKCGKKDYQFIVKNISKEIGFSSHKIKNLLMEFKKFDFVTIEQRATRCLWKTNFENKDKGDIEYALV